MGLGRAWRPSRAAIACRVAQSPARRVFPALASFRASRTRPGVKARRRATIGRPPRPRPPWRPWWRGSRAPPRPRARSPRRPPCHRPGRTAGRPSGTRRPPPRTRPGCPAGVSARPSLAPRVLEDVEQAPHLRILVQRALAELLRELAPPLPPEPRTHPLRVAQALARAAQVRALHLPGAFERAAGLVQLVHRQHQAASTDASLPVFTPNPCSES